MARDILKTLKAEHDELRALFEEMDGTTDRAKKKRAELLTQIEARLVPHAKWEEAVFYPAFVARTDRDGRKVHAEARQEHRAVELAVLPDLKAAATDTPDFAGRAKVLGEFVDHHATEEETTMFKLARRLFSAQERAEMDEQYEAWKKSPVSKAVLVHAEVKTGLRATVRKVVSA